MWSSARSEAALEAGLPVPIEIRPIRGARRLRLRFDDASGRLKLTCPLRTSRRSALAWALDQREWIDAQLERVLPAEPFAAGAKIATVSSWGSFADNGFLLSYGPILQDGFRRLARYVDRILRGVRPDELPIELPRTVELVINTRTARALGIKIPQSVLLRADRVIE